MKDFKKLIREAHLGNPLNEEDRATRVDKMLSGKYKDEDYKDSERYADVRADLEGEINEENEKFEKAARDEYGKPWMELSIAQKQELLSYMNRETEKQFQTDYERRRRGDYSDDMEDGMTDYQRRRMDEDMGEWPKELTSRYSDEYRFELEKVMSDRAKYRVIDIESGELKGTPLFGTPESLMAYADDLIKPQGGTQSSHFGTNEGTCGYGEDGKVDPENTDKLKPAGPANEMLMQALPVEKLTDKALLNLLNNLDDDTGKFTNAKSQLMKAAGDEVKKRGLKIHYVDNDRYEFMNEDMNDPVLVKARAAKMADEKEKAKQAALNKKYGSSFMDKLDAEIGLKQELQDLKDERAQLMIDMEQEAEPEGGEIADRYGSRLNDIDAKMAEIKSELDDLRMYESVNEDLQLDVDLYSKESPGIFSRADEKVQVTIPGKFGDNEGDTALEKALAKLGKKYASYKVKDVKELNEDDELNVNVDNANDNYAKAIDAESRSGAYESLQESLRKKLRERLK